MVDRGGYEGRFKAEDDHETKNDESNNRDYINIKIFQFY